MSTSSGIPPRGAPRTKLRKGTHSCQECRLRKTRCVPRPGSPLTCVECFSRGVRCRSQDVLSPQPDDRPTLRDRVARLEQVVQSLQSERYPPRGAEKDVAETLTNLRSYAQPPTPASSDLTGPSSSYHDNAPLLSLFDNAVLRRNDVISNNARHPPIHSLIGNEQLIFRRIAVREALLSPLPSPRDLGVILESAEGIWGGWQRMFPEVDAYDNHGSLKQFVFWGLSQESPVHIAMALLCVATSLQHLRPRIGELSLNLHLHPKDLMNHYFELVDRLIIADNEYVATAEGVNVIIFRAKCHFNLGQPRQCWLLFRQAISIAQLLGLTRKRKLQPDESQESTKKRLKAWRLRYQYDRYTSLLLGLPYAVMGDVSDTNADELTLSSPSSSDVLYQKLYAIAGRIIDRNQTLSSPPLILTLEIDQDLEDVIVAIPSSWWDIQSARSAGSISTSEYFARLMAQFWYYQIKSLLHLPFMLESSIDKRVEYSRIASFDATRKLLGLYHIMRSRDDDIGFDMCKVIDFQGFTAAVLLLLGLLGYGRISSAPDLQQMDSDWQLIEATRDILRRVSAEEGNSIAVQSLAVLEFLCAIRYETHSESDGQGFKWEGKLAIPCFGTVTISRGAGFSKPAAGPPSGSNRSAFPNTDMKEHSNDISDNQSSGAGDLHPAGFGDSELEMSYPHIDIDWQNMINVDLDEDWNWNVGGMEM